MMKKIILLFSITLCISALAQDTLVETTELSKPPSDEPIDEEKPAQYPGGANLFRQKIAKNFRGKKIIGNENMNCELIFIVDRNGSITHITATGNNQSFNQEAIRSVSKIKEKWTPAEINGEKVRYRVRLPLSFTFD